MRRRLQLSLMLIAALFATGSQWDFVQVFAWGRMIGTYAQSMPLREAVRLTFTPDNMCELCEAISEARHQQPAAAIHADDLGKIVLFTKASGDVVYDARESSSFIANEVLLAGIGRPEPAHRPPRLS